VVNITGGTMFKAFVFFADGFEEVEALAPVDFLRRAGMEVTTISVGASKTVLGAHNVNVIADALFDEVSADCSSDQGLPDMVVLPGGGGGAKNLAAHEGVDAFLKKMSEAKKTIAAICASPAVVLGPKGFLKNRNWTCHPGVEKGITDGTWKAEPVVVDTGNGSTLITSRGPGTAVAFSLAIVNAFLGKAEAGKLAVSIVADA
jgi:4-methyl-5(b-hydroxyethyl)-thiazole monophosphate biosynthesis